MKNIIILLFLIINSCGNINQARIIDYENKFYYRGHVNLYLLNEEKKFIKKFYKFSDTENLARQNVKNDCLNFIKINKLSNGKCIYMGTKPTEKMLTSLN
tara:strand:+ start:65 stop:364 length:300 start_codon:yes stop_codon:yes gene_type:complete